VSERETFDANREALQSSVGRTGPTSDRYRSALERYLAAAAAVDSQGALTPGAKDDGLFWKIGNNTVGDVMTRTVISVHKDAPFRQVVDLLALNNVGAVPVVDVDGAVLGVISTSDLLAKVAAGGERRVHARSHAARSTLRRKAEAETAEQLMTSPAVTIRANISIVDAAREAALAHVRRLPVVDADGHLLGIVTRSDMLRVFRRSDEEILAHITRDVIGARRDLDDATIEVEVLDGVVTLSGRVKRRLTVLPLVDAVRHTTGVVAVHDQLAYAVDDTLFPAPAHMGY